MFDNKKKVLIVEDEEKIVEVIKAYLEKDGWATSVAYNGEKAFTMFMEDPPNLVILDLMLGSMSGEQLTEKIRQRTNTPIIMITSKSRESDRISGLYLGADDYIVKPFSPNELVARAHAVYRRATPNVVGNESKLLSFDGGRIQIDTNKMIVYMDGIDIKVTNTEYKLLISMAQNREKIFTRGDLLYFVQGYRYVGDPRSIDAHIKNIRYKIEKDPKAPQVLLTVFGKGYKFGVNKDE